MATYKNIRIKKKGGGSRLQRVQVLASGKYKFVKNPKSKSRKVTSKKSGGKNKVGKKRSFTLPLTIVAGLGVGLAAGPYNPVDFAMQGNYSEALLALAHRYTGWHARDKRFDPQALMMGLGPLIIGAIAHKAASMLGVNRMLARAGVPFIRI